MTSPADASRSQARRLECAEVWASSNRTAGLLELPGVEVWVHSRPAESSEAGGDIHFVSVCPSCTVGRIALADVSGHGQAVRAVADEIRGLMTHYLTALAQDGLMRDLNRAITEQLDGVHYATMVAAGWHSRRGLLVLTNAGHLPPLVYRAERGDWSCVDARESGERSRRPVGVALGLVAEVDYTRTFVKPKTGDRVLLYSDGVSEARNASGDELGREGLMDIVRALGPRSAESLGLGLTEALRAFSDNRPAADDQTIVVLAW